MKAKIIFSIIFSLYASSLLSQISHGGRPSSFSKEYSNLLSTKLKSDAIKQIGELNIQDINKDEEKGKVNNLNKQCESCRRLQYGKEINVAKNFFEKGTLQTLEDGTKVWLLNIKSSNAEGYQFLFNKFELPEGSSFYIYNEDKSMVLGSFTSDNNRDDKVFVTQFILGNSVYLEYVEPKGVNDKALLELDKVVYIFDNIFIRKGPYSKDGADMSCQINTICPQGNEWRTEIKSVAMILEKTGADYWGVCSGTLINKEGNYMGTDKPYFLSANHCYELEGGGYSNLANWVFLFRHESSYCSSNGSEVPKSLFKSAVGADLVSKAAKNKSDYLLLKLKNSVDEIRDFDIAFAGWNNVGTASITDKVVGIHHPNGDTKKISISLQKPVPGNFWTGDISNMNHWKLIWSEGITAVGSSGSPLFNSNKQIIGMLTGGQSYCEVEKKDDKGKVIGGRLYPDYYGNLSQGWKDGKLNQYLTPSGFTSFSSYDPFPSNSLSITISSIPDKVWIGESFKLKASSTNGMANFTWYWWINKTPDDLADYPYGSQNCFNEHTITSIRESYTNSNTLTQAGTYKVNLLAFDQEGRQITKQFSLVVAERKDECISAQLFQTTCAKQIEFPMNQSIELRDYAYVINSNLTYQDNCHTYKFLGGTYWNSKYQGISKIKWFLDATLIKEYHFDTTQEYNNNSNICSYYYYPTNAPGCFSLTTEGEHTIKKEAYGGYLASDGNQFYCALNPTQFFSSVSKKIVVVDCDKNISVPTKANLTSNMIGGYINIWPTTSITINSGESYQLTGYRSVSLKTGVLVKAGGYLSIKSKDCPVAECGCASQKSRSIETSNHVITNERNTNTNDNFSITVYPNPTNDIFWVEVKENADKIRSIEILNTLGSIILKSCEITTLNKFDISGYPTGVYVIRVNSTNRISNYKLIKN